MNIQRLDEKPCPAARRKAAAKADVHPDTVDAVFGLRPTRQGTYEKIRDAWEELGYADVYPIPPRIRSAEHRARFLAKLAEPSVAPPARLSP